MNANDQQQALTRLKSFLEADPDNLPLLRDCAEAALAAGEAKVADECYRRIADLNGLSEGDESAAAVAAMRNGRAARAVELLEPLVAAHPEDPALRFNLAWSLALNRQPDRAADLLDDATTAALPQAAMLELQLRHERGDFDGAVDRIAPYLAAHGDYAPLQAAVSVLAMDVDDEDLARQAAIAGGDHPDALTTLGTLTLGDGDGTAAREMLERALAQNAGSPRTWMGLGLANLGLGETEEALAQVDRGAEMFGDHLGSWIAAGWAHLTTGDIETAEARFQKAMAIDDNFAECHGSLATIRAMKGEREAAERSILVALRLDRQCFSAAFAQMILAASEGNAERASAIFEQALDQPMDDRGRTLRQSLGKLAR